MDRFRPSPPLARFLRDPENSRAICDAGEGAKTPSCTSKRTRKSIRIGNCCTKRDLVAHNKLPPRPSPASRPKTKPRRNTSAYSVHPSNTDLFGHHRDEVMKRLLGIEVRLIIGNGQNVKFAFGVIAGEKDRDRSFLQGSSPVHRLAVVFAVS